MTSKISLHSLFYLLLTALLLGSTATHAQQSSSASGKQESTGTAIACEDPSSTMLWKVAGKNSTVHLFGSIHVGEASFYPLPEKIETTFRNADHVVFEVDPRAVARPATAARIQQLGTLPPGETLNDALSEPVVKKLRNTLGELGLPAENFMTFRPWFLTLALTSMQAMSLGYIPDYGVERYLTRELPAGASVLELETLDQQLDFLQSLDGEAYLAYTLFNYEAGKQHLQILVDAWRCADQDRLGDFFQQQFDVAGTFGPDIEKLQQELITNRNVGMAEKIAGYLEEGSGSYFVVVGAAHNIGEGSVVELLREKNYQVEAVRL